MHDLLMELDNLFYQYGLGSVYFENYKNTEAIWKTDEHDYVTISVPKHLKSAFDDFWTNACRMLEDSLEVYHVQKGVPVTGGGYLDETLYFISVESAMELSDQFLKILPFQVGGYYEYQGNYDEADGAFFI